MSRKNYTEREKRILAELVNKYRSIIANKCTNAITVEKKNRAWERVALEFNARAEHPRSAKQLNIAYQNLKRASRQKVPEENTNDCILRSDDLKLLLENDETEDTIEVKVEALEPFTPVMSEVDTQMLRIMGDPLKPLSNNCDSASEYHSVGEDINDDDTLHLAPMQIKCETIITEVVTEPTPPPPAVQTRAPNDCALSRKRPQNNIIENTATIKKKFYLKKLACASIEKKIKISQYKLSLKNEKLLDLELKIKELQYTSLLKSTENEMSNGGFSES